MLEVAHVPGRPARPDHLACVLYQCLAGQVPFPPRASETAAIVAHVTDPPPRPSERIPGLPPVLDAVVAGRPSARPL